MAVWNSRANDIFLDALDIATPVERQAFVERACSGDPEILAQVQSLLQANREAGEFLNSRHVAVIAAPFLLTEDNVREELGLHLGRYKLLERIAEGGMGVVYVAEQSQPIRRRVALKIIKPGLDSRQVIARFEAERQALALMDHPNIARVLDAGATESGRPYFVMELVRGVAITDFCEREQLAISERLRLFVSVCRAVQHAHQKGIIHRDLKPSNVLVTLHDGVPVAKVIDFGIAKALHQQLTEKTIYTGFGHMVGTPMYMSPEQAEMSGLDVDTRSDVYSLGVLLYELLTGVTPFDPNSLKQAGLGGLQQMLRETEPLKPSSRISTIQENLRDTLSDRRRLDHRRLEQLLRGDLDWVVMKALEKDRNRRYGSPAELADDLERHLQRQPVLAGPPSWRYKARKLVHRHRILLAVASLVVLAMVAGTAFSAWYALEADAARDRARQSEKLANERLAMLQFEQQNLQDEQQKSNRRFALARQAVARLMDDVATYQLLGSPELTEFRDSLLITAEEFYSQLIRESAVDAELYLARAGVREQLRRSQEVQSDLEEAARLKPRSARVHERLAEFYRNTADPTLHEPSRALEHALRAVELDPSDTRNWFTLGWVYRQHFPNRDDDAAKAFLKASETAQDVVGRADKRGMAQQIQVRYEDAIAAYTEGIESTPHGHYHLYAMRAACHTALGDLEAALADLTKSIELNAFSVDSYRRRATIWMRQGEYSQAADDLEKVLSFPPEQDVDRRNLLVCYLELRQWALAAGLVTKMAERPDTSCSHLTPQIFQRISSSGDPALLAARNHLDELITETLSSTNRHRELVDFLRGLSRYDDALRVCDEVIDNAGDRAPADLYYLRGEIRRANLKQFTAALPDFEQAIRIQPNFAEAYISLAWSLKALDRPHEAIPALQRGISRQSEPSARLWVELGQLAEDTADYALAERAFEQALQLEPDNAQQLNSIAWMLAIGRDDAARNLPRAIELARRALKIDSGHVTTQALNTLGVALYYAGQYDEAIAALQQSLQQSGDGSGVAYNSFFLAMAYWRTERRAEAQTALESAEAWMTSHPALLDQLARFQAEARKLITPTVPTPSRVPPP